MTSKTTSAALHLGTPELTSLIVPWYGLVSDRAREFDDVLLAPVQSWDAVEAVTGAFIEAKSKNDPNGPDTQTADLVAGMLRDLQHAGED